MKSFMTFTTRRCHQRGFSALEILIATVMISLLIASGIYYTNIGDKVSAVDITAAKAAAVVRFPEALMLLYSRQQTLAGVTAADLTGTGSVRAGAPFTWAVASAPNAPTQNRLSLDVTFKDSGTAAAMATYLNNSSDETMVDSAAVSNGNNKLLTVTYEVQ